MTWKSFDTLQFEIEGTHSTTDETLALQTRSLEIKSQSRHGRKCDEREGRQSAEKADGKGSCAVKGQI